MEVVKGQDRTLISSMSVSLGVLQQKGEAMTLINDLKIVVAVF